MMETYIVDTNLVFSAILNPKNPIGQFILSAHQNNVKLYAPDFLTIELERYIPKLLELSKIEEKEVRRITSLIFSKISFIADNIIPFECYKNAVPFVRDVDMDDLVFVALTNYLDETLWTGDLKLYKALKSKGYEKVVSFEEIKEKF